MKQFNSLQEMSDWVLAEKSDRYSPYDILWEDINNLTVYYFRID